jgi:YegS/Rv2252/BmrU family lipid kinase
MTDRNQNAFVVINAHSGTGRGEPYRAELVDLFRQHGVLANVKLASDGEETAKFVEQAANSDSDLVVAGGGDGTINALVNAIRDRNKVLGVLPLGTFNHFAKDIGLPLDLEQAVEVICSGTEQRIDFAEVNGHAFVNNSGVGLYPQIVHQREQQQQLGHSKWAAFVWAALTVWRRFSFLHVHLKTDHRLFDSRTPMIFVGNNRYEMEGLNIGARTCLCEGELSVYLTKRTTRWGLVVLALRALFGRLRGVKDFVSLTTTEMRIVTGRKNLRVAVDGEIMELKPPLIYRIHAGGLRVMVPRREGGNAK